MGLSNRLRPSAVVAIAAITAVVAILPGAAAARDGSAPGSIAAGGGAYDLGAALDANGVFHGIAGPSGTVDIAEWTLVSDVAAGQAPRFERAKRVPNVAPADTGPLSDPTAPRRP